MTKRELDFDVAIIGGGPGGMFTAYELINLYPKMKKEKELSKDIVQKKIWVSVKNAILAILCVA